MISWIWIQMSYRPLRPRCVSKGYNDHQLATSLITGFGKARFAGPSGRFNLFYIA
jgi:hypothetical protein